MLFHELKDSKTFRRKLKILKAGLDKVFQIFEKYDKQDLNKLKSFFFVGARVKGIEGQATDQGKTQSTHLIMTSIQNMKSTLNAQQQKFQLENKRKAQIDISHGEDK